MAFSELQNSINYLARILVPRFDMEPLNFSFIQLIRSNAVADPGGVHGVLLHPPWARH